MTTQPDTQPVVQPVPRTGGGTQTIEATRPETSHGDGDHERFAHYVRKDKIVDSAVLGSPVVALCGKVWVPNRDPQKFPVCPTCKEVYESLQEGGDSGAGGTS